MSPCFSSTIMMSVVTILREATKTISPMVRNSTSFSSFRAEKSGLLSSIQVVVINPGACPGTDIFRNGLGIFQIVYFELKNESGSSAGRKTGGGRRRY